MIAEDPENIQLINEALRTSKIPNPPFSSIPRILIFHKPPPTIDRDRV